MKLYEQVAAELQQRIEEGFYQCGDRLPSVRSLSQAHQVSIATVQEAYRRLEDQGLAEPRPKSGYYVRQRCCVPNLPEPSRPAQRPLEVSQWEQVLDLLCGHEGEGVVALGHGMPDLTAPTLKPLLRLTGDLYRRAQTRGLEYDSLPGTRELRSQAARLAVDSGCRLHPDDIVITAGCQDAIFASMRAVTKPGDVVAVDSPSFYGSMQAIRALGLKVVEIPTHPETGISLEALELALEQWPITALQIVPTCNNPLGYTMPDAHKRRLVSLAQRFDIVVIEDDTYGDLAFQYPRPRTVKSFDPDGRVMLCTSFSKTVASGLRIGWAAPGRHRDEVVRMKYVAAAACPILPQLALAEFVAQGGYERHVRRMRAQYRRGRDAMLERLERYFPAGTRISYPQGGFLLWVELPGDVDTVALNQRLPALGVRIAPGVLFSASGKYRNCMRLNFATEMDARIDEALRTVGAEVKRLLEEQG